ncbi:MAG: DUF1854 domain-containing protein [Candidatus Zhuqueibacterota bacterium]
MMTLLNPAELSFSRSENGFLKLKTHDGQVFDSVECTPLFPLSQPERFISVTHREDGQVKELGFIADLNSLPNDQQVFVREEIVFRYFSPEILDINKITSQYGVDQWDVVTEKGDRTFLVRDIKENIIIRDNGFISITDIERCRFQISDYRKLPIKAQLELEQTLL